MRCAVISQPYKVVDKDAATAIKKLLCENFIVEVFQSSDDESIPGGQAWRTAINNALENAKYLLLLFTDTQYTWDWCMYEAGYFLRNQHDAVDRHLMILHPVGVPGPGPLSDIETSETNPQRLADFLQRALETAGAQRCPR